MAFGFPAYHQEDVTLPYAITHDWVVYACQISGLGAARWAQAPTGGMWLVTSNASLMSWGETMTVTPLAPTVVRVRSECGLPTQCIDFGKNERNVKKLVQALWAAVQQPQPLR